MSDPDERWGTGDAREPLDDSNGLDTAEIEADEIDPDELDDVGEGPDEGAESGDGEFDPEAG